MTTPVRWSLRVLAASLIVSVTAMSSPHRAERCGSTLRSFETRWGSADHWRALAPYPEPRWMSPTDSIGVWLERRTLADGRAELRRVSAGETIVMRGDGSDCRVQADTLRREYSESAAGFTDGVLRALVQRAPRGMVYVWSPGMPLSVRGIDVARAAARTLGIAFTAVVADSVASFELVYRNATIHYPAVVLYRDGVMLDGVIPGYKSQAAYELMMRRRLENPAIHSVQPDPAGPSLVPRMWVDHKARVTTTSSVATPRDIGFFFKPVAGTSLVTYTANERAYLFDRVTRTERRIPGHVDPVPTPDGLFLTRPGLIVYPMDALRRGDTTSIFIDEELPDEYQTASVLSRTKTSLRYRVVTGWRENARFRDYDVVLPAKGDARGSRGARFTAAGAAFVPCADRALSLPISAKSGREFGAFDVARETNGVLEVTADGKCVDRLDLGFASGKLSFSYDGRLLAFSTSGINVDTAGTLRKASETFYQDALLVQRANGRLVPLSRNRSLHASSFPEFLPDGSVMVLDQRAPGQPAGALRTITVK